jgi:hypothetical protein
MGKPYIVQRAFGLVSPKLGRCSFCMGFALSGAVIGWLALAAAVSVWPRFPYLNLLAVWPLGFTVLWLLHLTTFGARRVAGERRGITGPVMSRRQMAGVFLGGVGVAMLASALAAPRALGGFTCTKNEQCKFLGKDFVCDKSGGFCRQDAK